MEKIKNQVYKISLLDQCCKSLLSISIYDLIRATYHTQYISNTNYLKEDFFVNITHNTNHHIYQSYIDQRTENSGFNHRKDARDIWGYLQELVFGWLVEDMMCAYLISKHHQVQLSGADHAREILDKPNSKADLYIKNYDHDIYIEILTDYHQYRSNHLCVDLRDHKYQTIKICGSHIIGLDVQKCQFVCIKSIDIPQAEYIAHHKPRGNKSVYRIHYNPQKSFFDSAGMSERISTLS